LPAFDGRFRRYATLEFEPALCANGTRPKLTPGMRLGQTDRGRFRHSGAVDMVEKIIDLIGISSNSIEDAVEIALARAGVTISGIHYAHVKDITATVENNKVSQWRVAIQVSFMVKDQLHE
jgi:flavin-binding protein dodecin